LEPPKRLPDIWKDYLRKKHRLRLDGDAIDINHYYKHSVPMRCKDEAGILLKGTLEDKVKDWLNKPIDESRSLILLGEFGDGKSVFTYVLARKLIDEYWLSPSTGWIPVRFALKNLGTNTNKDTRDFLENRMKDFDITLGKWNDLKFGDFNVLILLDGFDEMSKKLDAENCIKEYRLLN
jgi:predicted NACHT family NTPase